MATIELLPELDLSGVSPEAPPEDREADFFSKPWNWASVILDKKQPPVDIKPGRNSEGHFGILVLDAAGEEVEFHLGALRVSKVVDPNDLTKTIRASQAFCVPLSQNPNSELGLQFSPRPVFRRLGHNALS